MEALGIESLANATWGNTTPMEEYLQKLQEHMDELREGGVDTPRDDLVASPMLSAWPVFVAW